MNSRSTTKYATVHIIFCFGAVPIYLASKVEIPNIENKLKSERKRGWGLQLVAELMDTVEYDSDESGTTVTMTKKKEGNE